MTPTAADQLAQILAQSSPSFQSGQPAQLYDIDWDQALPQARSLLTPAQYGALETASAPQRWLGRITAILQETKTAANGPPPAP